MHLSQVHNGRDKCSCLPQAMSNHSVFQCSKVWQICNYMTLELETEEVLTMTCFANNTSAVRGTVLGCAEFIKYFGFWFLKTELTFNCENRKLDFHGSVFRWF